MAGGWGEFTEVNRGVCMPSRALGESMPRHRGSSQTRSLETWVLGSALPCTCCVTLGSSWSSLSLGFSHLKHEHKISRHPLFPAVLPSLVDPSFHSPYPQTFPETKQGRDWTWGWAMKLRRRSNGGTKASQKPSQQKEIHSLSALTPGLGLGLGAVSPTHLASQGLQGPGSHDALQRRGLV